MNLKPGQTSKLPQSSWPHRLLIRVLACKAWEIIPPFCCIMMPSYRKLHSLIKYKSKGWAFLKLSILSFLEKWLECENIFVLIAIITLVVIRPALTALMKHASHSWSWKLNPARICYGLCGLTASSEQDHSRLSPFPSLLWCIHLLKMYIRGKHATEPVVQLQLLGH